MYKYIFQILFPVFTLGILFYSESLFEVLKEESVDVTKWRTYATTLWSAAMFSFLHFFYSNSARLVGSVKFCKVCATRK